MSENTDNMVTVGLDTSRIRGDLNEIQNYLNRNPVKLSYTLDKSSLKKTVDQLSAQISVDTGKVNSSVGGALKSIKDMTSSSLKSMVAGIGTGGVTSLTDAITSSGRAKICCFALS